MITNKIDFRNIIDKEYYDGLILQGTLSVNGDDKVICVIDSDYMKMLYRRKVNGFMKYVHKYIHIDWTSKNDGNKEAYFICPFCGRRTLVIYHRRQLVLCRKCIGLTRKSICRQYEFMPYSEQ